MRGYIVFNFKGENMTEYKAVSPEVEVSGQTILSVLNALTTRTLGLKFLAENGIKDPQPDAWYPQQAWLNAFKQIGAIIGPNTLARLGGAIPESAKFPPNIDSMHKALELVNIAYHMNHRINKEILFNPTTGQLKDGIGYYKYSKTGENSAEMTCDNPYPLDFNKGLILAMTKKFKPAGAIVDVQQKFVEDLPVFIVRW